MRASRGLWLLMAVACGRSTSHAPKPGEVEPLFVSGERLRARVADAGGGARRLLDWFDTVLETNCTFRPMDDGVYRCVPAGEKPRLAGFSSFADDACTVVIDTQGLCPLVEGTYIARGLPRRTAPWAPWPSPSVACGSDIEDQPPHGEPVGAYRLGAALSASQTVFHLSQGECEPGEAQAELHVLDPVAPELLVAATRRFEARGDALTLEILEGEDGSRVVSTVYDAHRKRPCDRTLSQALLEDYRCLNGNENAAADERCEHFGVLAACDDELTMVTDGDLPLSEWFHVLGARVETARVREGTNAATCGDDSWPLPEGLHLYEHGPPFSVQQLPGLTSGLLGSGRVRVPFSRARDDVQPLFVNDWGSESAYFKPGPFWDGERGEPCDWQLGSDGVTRCFPTQMQGTRYYAAPDCSVPLVFAESPGSLSPTLVEAFPTLAEMCANERLLGGLFITAERASYDHFFGLHTDGTCERFEGPQDFHETVEVDLEDFAEITILID